MMVIVKLKAGARKDRKMLVPAGLLLAPVRDVGEQGPVDEPVTKGEWL